MAQIGFGPGGPARRRGAPAKGPDLAGGPGRGQGRAGQGQAQGQGQGQGQGRAGQGRGRAGQGRQPESARPLLKCIDLESACKQFAIRPADSKRCVVSLKRPSDGEAVGFFVSHTLPFGSANSTEFLA